MEYELENARLFLNAVIQERQLRDLTHKAYIEKAIEYYLEFLETVERDLK